MQPCNLYPDNNYFLCYIIEVISKYMEIDVAGLDIQITQTESEGGNGIVPAIYANIPIKELKAGR